MNEKKWTGKRRKFNVIPLAPHILLENKSGEAEEEKAEKQQNPKCKIYHLLHNIHKKKRRKKNFLLHTISLNSPTYIRSYASQVQKKFRICTSNQKEPPFPDKKYNIMYTYNCRAFMRARKRDDMKERQLQRENQMPRTFWA